MISDFKTKPNSNVEVVDAGYGLGAVAARDLRAGEVVGSFTGLVQEFQDFKTDDVCYLLAAGGKDLWLYPDAPERFLNHSCDPNVSIQNLFTLVAKTDIAKGDILAFAYDEVSAADMQWLGITAMTDPFLRWPDQFVFACQCQKPKCRQLIDRNIVVSDSGVRPQALADVILANLVHNKKK